LPYHPKSSDCHCDPAEAGEAIPLPQRWERSRCRGRSLCLPKCKNIQKNGDDTIMKKTLGTLIILLLSSLLNAQQGKWVTVTGEAYLEGNKTPKEAKNEALRDARKKAIETVVGIKIKDRLMILERSDDPVTKAVSLTESYSAGRIVEQEKPVWQTETREIEPGKPLLIVYKVNLRVKVVKDVRKKDSFKLNASLNKEQYYTGDEMRISVKPTEDCYITIFNFAADNTVYVLFPNPFQANNYVKKNQKIDIPTDSEIKRGIKYELSLPDGMNSHIEVIKIIGVQEDNPIQATEKLENSIGMYKIFTSVSDYEEVTKWILSLPEGKFAEEDVQYNIIRK